LLPDVYDTSMTSHTKVCILITFVLIAFGSACMSQTFDRTSLSHYLCWFSAFTAGGGAAWIMSKFKAME
jgi:hypothetical protein